MPPKRKNVQTVTDEQIIADHPGATPFELHTTHGLSAAGYEKLLSQDANTATKQPSNLLIPSEVKATGAHKIQPELSKLPLRPHAGLPDNTTMMVRDTTTGKTFPMSRFAGERAIRKNPARFKNG